MNKQVAADMSKISTQLLEQRHVRLLGSESWAFPLQLTVVSMNTVVRSQMDVLMKMILMILERLEVKQANEISELLAVETIFIEHMLELMMQSKMVEIVEGTYRLTPLGVEQVNLGTFVHDSMEEQVELAFSPYHQEALKREYHQTVMGDGDQVPNYRFEKEAEMVDVTELDKTLIKKMIEDSGYEFLVEKGQKLINEITSIEIKETVKSMCYEFHLHDKTEDTVFVRVWNTWTEQFDVQFETELNQKEAVRLRNHYFEQSTS